MFSFATRRFNILSRDQVSSDMYRLLLLLLAYLADFWYPSTFQAAYQDQIKFTESDKMNWFSNGIE